MTMNYATRAEGRAMYLCAGQLNAHQLPSKNVTTLRPTGAPANLPDLTVLDYLDQTGNPLFRYNRGLFSAGQFLGRPSPQGIPSGVYSRRPGVTILTDSGGLQFARGKAQWLGDASRRWTLEYAEANGDEAIGLDIPTLAPAAGHPLFTSFNICLQTTLDNNRYWLAHRQGNTRFLAVLQGTNIQETRTWLRAAMAVPMEGWAIGDPVMRKNYRWLAEALVTLLNAGLLGKERNRVHVLGEASLTHAVMLSALQRSLREMLEDEDFLITFDTASPSENASWGKAYGSPRMNRTSWTMEEFKPPSYHANAGHGSPFPILSSALAERMAVSDLCLPSSNRQHGWDSFGTELVTHHNVESLLRGIDQANSVMELPQGWKDDLAPVAVIKAYESLSTMWKYASNWRGHLSQSSRHFNAL